MSENLSKYPESIYKNSQIVKVKKGFLDFNITLKPFIQIDSFDDKECRIYVDQEKIQIGKTLDQLGYKGYKFNDYISVCDTHANFLIIKEDCKYEDVLLSLTFLEKVLYNYLGKKVELEIQVIDKYGKRKKYGT